MDNIKRDGVMEDAMEKVKEYGREQYKNGWNGGYAVGIRHNEKVIEDLESSLNALDHSIDLYENIIDELKYSIEAMKNNDNDRYNEGFQAGLDEAKMNCQEEIEALRHELINERHMKDFRQVWNPKDDTPKSKTIIFNVDGISLSEDDDE